MLVCQRARSRLKPNLPRQTGTRGLWDCNPFGAVLVKLGMTIVSPAGLVVMFDRPDDG